MPTIKLYDSAKTPYTIKVSQKQKIIYIHRAKGINFKLNQTAMKNLSADAYLLYMYLLTRKEGRAWVLSSQDVFTQTALKKRTYTNALAELIERKYLILGPIEGIEQNKNTYHLFESPKDWNGF